MSQVFVCGMGAVSPAGWGVDPLHQLLSKGEQLPATSLPRPGWETRLLGRPVSGHRPQLACWSDPRLRRTSPITHYAVAAALEALSSDQAAVQTGELSLGIVFCVSAGCVSYSRRFYDETWKQPGAASPLVFPETVFNAPASHVSALLGTRGLNYSLVGDAGMFLQGLSIGAEWLASGQADAILVIGAEELDWLGADAYRHFDRRGVLSAGAGALYLKPTAPAGAAVSLERITSPRSFSSLAARAEAARQMREELPASQPNHLLCDSRSGSARFDRAEDQAWSDWTGLRVSPRRALGEAFTAAAAWQCVAALTGMQLGQYEAATISVVGLNQQAIGAHFVLAPAASV